VARLLCYSLLGADWDRSPYTSAGERVLTLAANGLRLVLADQRAEHTPILKSGKPGKTKISYAEPEQAVAALWKYVDGAATASELYGRTLVVIAAQRYARQEVLGRSAQRLALRLESHKDIAEKALRKLIEPHVPAALKALQRAIARQAVEHDRKQRALPATAAATVSRDESDTSVEDQG
jgi:hypothetical protein